MTKTKITLAGCEYDIQAPLTLGQIIDLRVGMAQPAAGDPQAETKRIFTSSLDIIALALKPAYPAMTPEAMMAMPITEVELTTAALIVLELSGLKLKGDKKPGEAQAEAKAA